MVYCIPDVACFNHNNIDTPAWFEDLGGRRGEKSQQLSLDHAMRLDLDESRFAASIQQLTGIDLEYFNTHFRVPIKPDECGAAFLFVLIVVNSGRRALEVLQLANMARHGGQSNSDSIVSWLRDLWECVNRACNSAFGPGVPKLINTKDHRLDRHIASIHYGLQCTWPVWIGYLPYDLRQKGSMSEHDLRNALAAELQP